MRLHVETHVAQIHRWPQNLTNLLISLFQIPWTFFFTFFCFFIVFCLLQSATLQGRRRTEDFVTFAGGFIVGGLLHHASNMLHMVQVCIRSSQQIWQWLSLFSKHEHGHFQPWAGRLWLMQGINWFHATCSSLPELKNYQFDYFASPTYTYT